VPPATPVPPGVGDAPALVRHYGPGPDDPGGMSAVVAAYLDLPLTRHRVVSTASYRPGARAASLVPFLGALARLLAPGGAPPVVHAHLSEGGSFLREGGLAAVAGLRGARVVVSLHGADFATFAARRARLVRAVLGRADVVVALGPAGAGAVAPLLRPRTRLAVVPNPVSLPRHPGPAGERPETVVFAGEVGRRKGADVLLAAWPLVRAARPAARLVLAGPPGDVAPPPLPGVQALGPRPRAAVGDLLAGARTAVLPSRAEVLPVFLLEAMAAARPVVATPVGEVAALVDGAGALVPPGDPAALAAALVDVLADPGLATARGEAGRRRVAATHAPAAVAAALTALYDPPGRRSVT